MSPNSPRTRPTGSRPHRRERAADGREGVLQRDDVARRLHGAGGRARRARLHPRRPEGPAGPALDDAVVGTAVVGVPAGWFRENLKLGEGGEEGIDNDVARATFERTGASVMGKNMFDAGELSWPEE